ncbi:hypothetical protein, partial [Shigella sonnei]|uniref:hypothetical protein n=1 Tax=Shigella sonnei TaxID=624 RepID=UPI001C12CCAF
PCSDRVRDTIQVHLLESPSVDAGEGELVCEGDTVFLSGIATNYDSLKWKPLQAENLGGQFIDDLDTIRKVEYLLPSNVDSS